LDLERSFGFLVNDVARLFGRRFDHNGRRLGLTRAQCRTLGYIARNEGINQAGLADLLENRPMTLVRQIDRMEEAGWIERRPDPADRRARRLFLTAKARPILGRILIANETRDEALAPVEAGEAGQLIDLLKGARDLSERCRSRRQAGEIRCHRSQHGRAAPPWRQPPATTPRRCLRGRPSRSDGEHTGTPVRSFAGRSARWAPRPRRGRAPCATAAPP
jgi:DNA-binding MarR family transcriptional regulator